MDTYIYKYISVKFLVDFKDLVDAYIYRSVVKFLAG